VHFPDDDVEGTPEQNPVEASQPTVTSETEPEPVVEVQPESLSESEPETSTAEAEPPKLKLGIKPSGSQSELSLESAPRGRFEGESPNVFDGEDLDLPPFLRKKK
jgi:cell division protein FtsZ